MWYHVKYLWIGMDYRWTCLHGFIVYVRWQMWIVTINIKRRIKNAGDQI